MAQNDQNSTPQNPTPPADNGNQSGEKLFTQEEVNNIVKERLARERAKYTPQEPTAEEKQQADLALRESRLSCREYVMDQGLPSQLMDVLDTSDYEKFKKMADTVSGLMKTNKPVDPAADAAVREMKLRIAGDLAIPKELAERLTGSTEAEIYKDALVMTGIIRAIKGPPPLHSSEPVVPDEFSGFKKTKHTPRQY